MTRINYNEMRNQIFRKDGTLVGVYYVELRQKNYYLSKGIQVSVDNTTTRPFKRWYGIQDDFYIRYAEVVETLARRYGISQKSRLFDEMMDSVDAFKLHYRLDVNVEIRKIEFQEVRRRPRPRLYQ